MEAKFKVGDIVIIRQRIPGRHYKIGYLNGMTLHAGEIGTVTKVHNCGSYNIYNVHCNGFCWSEDMLDLVTRGNELSSPEPLDLIPKKKHYSFNFAV